MLHVIAFALISTFFIYISRKSLLRPRTHGFYRFFAWESMLTLVLLNIDQWTLNPFSPVQLVSWFLLLTSIFLVLHGIYLLRVLGKPDQKRSDDELLAFEKTSALITQGAYRYIRHPLYSSLLFFTWGAYLKDPSRLGILLALTSSLFLFITAKRDESECLAHFGTAYQSYMLGTRRFIPFVF